MILTEWAEKVVKQMQDDYPGCTVFVSPHETRQDVSIVRAYLLPIGYVDSRWVGPTKPPYGS